METSLGDAFIGEVDKIVSLRDDSSLLFRNGEKSTWAVSDTCSFYLLIKNKSVALFFQLFMMNNRV